IGAVGVAASLVFAPILVPVGLGLIGFSAIGPVAGSLAAIIQAGIGNVMAGSLFAIAQSIAMGGAFPAAFSAICATLTGGISAALALLL
ncbi:hypothetical protein BGW80DRAFT_1167856, partial [Lactifluus volemus]